MQKSAHSYFSPVLFMLFAYLFFFLLKSPEEASNSCVSALLLCFTKVIPSLFPFLVLSEIIISSGMLKHLSILLGGSLSKVFNISKLSSLSFYIGALLGFPLGAKFSISLYEKGLIDKCECEKCIAFCSNTGPSFILGIVGSILNKKIALCIYICQLLSAFIIGLALRNSSKPYNKSFDSTYVFDSKSPAELLPSCVTSSIFPMLNICAFVCFFSVIQSSVDNILSHLALSEGAGHITTGLLEITNGIMCFEGAGINAHTVFCISMFVGWSGLSVILQTVSLGLSKQINFKKYVISKGIQGILCAVLSTILCLALNFC